MEQTKHQKPDCACVPHIVVMQQWISDKTAILDGHFFKDSISDMAPVKMTLLLLVGVILPVCFYKV